MIVFVLILLLKYLKDLLKYSYLSKITDILKRKKPLVRLSYVFFVFDLNELVIF